MPKMRSHKGASKRFASTGTGAIVRRHAMRSHLLVNKSSKRKRLYRSKHAMAAIDVKNIRRIVPYL